MKRHILVACLVAATVGLSACEQNGETSRPSAAPETGVADKAKGMMEDAMDSAKKMTQKAIEATREMAVGATKRGTETVAGAEHEQ